MKMRASAPATRNLDDDVRGTGVPPVKACGAATHHTRGTTRRSRELPVHSPALSGCTLQARARYVCACDRLTHWSFNGAVSCPTVVPTIVAPAGSTSGTTAKSGSIQNQDSV